MSGWDIGFVHAIVHYYLPLVKYSIKCNYKVQMR